eukprot:351422-Chlamydomonas_euryale.AAC.4
MDWRKIAQEQQAGQRHARKQVADRRAGRLAWLLSPPIPTPAKSLDRKACSCQPMSLGQTFSNLIPYNLRPCPPARPRATTADPAARSAPRRSPCCYAGARRPRRGRPAAQPWRVHG